MKPENTVRKKSAALFVALVMGSFPLLAANTATQLLFTVQPASTVVGAGITNVVVQLADKNGTNVAQSGVTISLALNKSGLTGTTNVATDATGKAAFTNLKISLAGNSDTLSATASGLKSATSSSFNVSKGVTTTTLAASTNFLVYGLSATFTATVGTAAPASGTPTGTVTFKDGTATLGTAALNASGSATFSTNRISAATANRTITAVYAGDSNFSTSTSSNLSLATGKLALTVAGAVANNKIYDGGTNATLIFSNATLATVLSGDTVTLNSAAAKGAFASKTAGTGKTVTITGLTLTGASAGNYSITAPTATANITARSLVITAKGVNKIYDGTTNATVTLTDNRVAGDSFTNSYLSAAFAGKNVGTAISINVSGLASGGADAGNYALSNLTAATSANITAAALTVSGLSASDKVYDRTTAATLNFTNATLATIFAGDAVTLNTAATRGVFASKTVGSGKTVTISGLALAGTNAGNYTLASTATTTASITARSLTITAKGVNKIYDGTTNATVTLTDNHVAGDALTDSYTSAAFTNKNVGTAISINVYSLAITGTDSTNYALTATNTSAAANITKATLTVSGVAANNKIYDGTITATLNFSNAALVTVFSGDSVTLNSAAAKGTFASKAVGTNKTVSVSGLALSGANSNNYALTQPATTANITPRALVITAKGVNKIYDGTTAATVTLADNRVAGDALTNSYASAAFTNKNVATNILINVYGLANAGADSGNYNLSATNTTATANITTATLTVTADNLSRPYGVTNPILTATIAGFVTGESLTNSDVTGSPVPTTTAKTNSNVGAYPITAGKGSLAARDYTFKLVNGTLTVTPADTAALLSTTLNPARTNQNITFAAQIRPLAATVLVPTGVIQFKCNGTNKLGNAVSVTNSGTANLTVMAASLGQSNAVITAEYSDPAGNFSPSTNSLTQNILIIVTPPPPPPPSKLSLAPAFANGVVAAQLAGVTGQTYVIEVSADLIHWTAISTNVADTNGIVSLVDSNAVAFPSRFYRAYSP
jgi:aspartate carbamoyltransferase regulatory subunit